MNLTESYNGLYTSAKKYNELVEAEKREQKRFSDIAVFLDKNSGVIKRYGLEAEICKLFNNNADLSIKSIKALIDAKRQEEEDLLRLKRLERERKEVQRKKIIKWTLISLAAVALIVLIIATRPWSFIIIGAIVAIIFYMKAKD